jgi:CBS domain-containing protein
MKSLVDPVPPSDLVSTIMSTKVVSAKPTEKVGKVLRMMVRHKIGSIVAVEHGKPVGILTERDVSIRTAKGQNVRSMLIKNMMSKPLMTISPSTEVWQAVELMVRKDLRRLPVVEGDKLVGMVTERDVLRWLVKVAYEPNLPEDLKKLLETRAQAHSIAS